MAKKTMTRIEDIDLPAVTTSTEKAFDYNEQSYIAQENEGYRVDVARLRTHKFALRRA